MRSEQVRISNKLTGEWHHANECKQLFIYCHGYQGSSKDPTIISIVEGLNNKGYDTFAFNFSENSGGFDIEQQVFEILTIINRFSKYKELFLIAGSFAALPAAIATIKTTRVRRLVTLNGFFGTSALGQEHRKNYLKFRLATLVIPKYRKILTYYKQELQPSRIKVPVLVIHSKADKYVYIRQSHGFYDQLISSKHFVELKNASHGITSSKDRQIVVSEINKWLKTKKH